MQGFSTGGYAEFYRLESAWPPTLMLNDSLKERLPNDAR
jgi:hypothetical protein